MVNASTEDLIRRVAMGDRTWLETLLKSLAGQVVFLGVKKLSDSEKNMLDTLTVRTNTISKGDLKLLPVFTSENHFYDWATSVYEPLPLYGEDLFLLKENTEGLVLNPESVFSLEIEPNELDTFLTTEKQRTDTSTDGLTIEGDKPLSDITVLNADAAELPKEQGDHTQVIDKLRLVFTHFPQVEEAFFLNTPLESTSAALGVKAKNLGPEERFLLVSEIAAVSKEFYGMAGAIEVFDDLANKGSASWGFFREQQPFFVSASYSSQEKREVNGMSETLQEKVEFETFSGKSPTSKSDTLKWKRSEKEQEEHAEGRPRAKTLRESLPVFKFFRAK